MFRIISITFILFLSLSAYAQQIYKWIDENGQFHYGNTLPPQPQVDNITRDISKSTGKLTTRRESAANAYHRTAESYRSMRTPNRTLSTNQAPRQIASTPAKISYDDQMKIQNLHRRIDALSTSTMGSTSDRSRQIEAAKAELAGIYAKYGMYPYSHRTSRTPAATSSATQ
jgi:hypothetical protein